MVSLLHFFEVEKWLHFFTSLRWRSGFTSSLPWRGEVASLLQLREVEWLVIYGWFHFFNFEKWLHFFTSLRWRSGLTSSLLWGGEVASLFHFFEVGRTQQEVKRTPEEVTSKFLGEFQNKKRAASRGVQWLRLSTFRKWSNVSQQMNIYLTDIFSSISYINCFSVLFYLLFH